MKICITGATSGIGKAALELFVEKGHQVLAIGRNEAHLKALVQQYPDSVMPIALDVRDSEKVKEALKSHSDIDLLVNNAGLALGLDPAQRGDLEDWNVMVDTNIKAVLNLTHFVLPEMVKRNQGHIINIGSVAGMYPYVGGNIYGGTKAFIHQFSLNLRADLLGTKIRVSCIEPGLVKTNFSETRYKGDHEKAEKSYKDIEYLTAKDIAESIFWVATLPQHVNINVLEIMPTAQAFGGFSFHRHS